MSGQQRAFPPELRKALKALSNETRESIFLGLTQEGASYTELLHMMNIRKGSLTHHLKTLMTAGLVRNFSRGRMQGPYDSFYATTGFGQSLVNGILEGIEPPMGYLEGSFESITTPLATKFFQIRFKEMHERFKTLESISGYWVDESLTAIASGATFSGRPPAMAMPLATQR